MDQSRQQIANLFGQGPVLLFFDGTAPAHHGLTDAMRHAVVCAHHYTVVEHTRAARFSQA